MAADIRDFLTRVLPWPSDDEDGYINIHVMFKKDDRTLWSGSPTTSINQFLAEVNKALKWRTPPDIYMCMSRQAKTRLVNGNVRAAKHAEDAICLKSIWLDIDIGKKGANQSVTDALKQIVAFCQKTHLPSPTALVASGGGLHVYWISKKTLTIDEWRPYAYGLKQAALDFGLLCDAGLTGDAARVLRIPGTFNHKTPVPRPVLLKHLKEQDYDFEVDLGVLPALSQMATVPLAQANPVFIGTPSKVFSGVECGRLGAGLEGEEIKVDLLSAAEAGCGWLQEAFTTGGKEFSQGLWNLATLAATFAEDGHAYAHKMADGHPDYNYDTTEKLWGRKLQEREQKALGWPSCKAIQAEGCKHCGTCKFLAVSKSPLHLARVSTPATVLSSQVQEAVPKRYFRPPALVDSDLPDGFVVRNGIIHHVEQIKAKGENLGLDYKPLIYNEIFEPWVQKANEPNGKWGLNIVIKEDAVTFGNRFIDHNKLHVSKLIDHLYTQQIRPAAANQKLVERFFVAWIDKLLNAAEAAEAKCFGWSRHQDTGKIIGFTYGGKTYNVDGTIKNAGFMERGMKDIYQPRGDKQAWLDGCKALTNMHRPGLECIVAAGFASPLLVATGHYSGFLCVCGDSGSGKTTAAKLALSIWANPKLAKEGPTSTVKSVIHKTGRTRNLPVVWDEIMNESSQETIHTALFVNALGAEGSRLRSDITLQERGDWQMISILCSNPSFSDYVIKKNPSTAAGLYRLIEYKEGEIGKKATLSDVDATRLYGALDWNYGRVGEAYAQLMVSDWEAIEQRVVDTTKWFEETCSLSKGERYWGALAATLLVGAEQGVRLGAEFDLNAMRQFLVAKIVENRNVVMTGAVKGGSTENVEALLTAFLKAMTGKTLRTRTLTHITGKGKPSVECVQYPMPNNPVHVQWDLSMRKLMVSQAEFNVWLRHPTVNASPRLTKDGLRQHYSMTTERRCMGANTIYRQGQEDVMVFPVAVGSELEQQMNSYEKGAN